ncbi:DMT family transporter [Nibrella saemangeumensis]|uniref:DMT family transporter n=2 Tax=Nibrella saemangeumensis TaxID=1084526 RepID=A0ABP8MV23_9BACT
MGAFMVFVSAFCFAMKGILIKLAYQYPIDAISLLSLRLLFALPFYVGIAYAASKRLPPTNLTRRQWLSLVMLGIIGYYLASYFNFLGLVYITAGLERILLFVYPTFVLLMNAVLYRRSVSRLQWGALFLTYAGILLAFLENIETGEQRDLILGSFWVIVSGIVYAVYLVGSDSMIARVGAQRYTCYALIAATVPTVIHNFIHNGFHLGIFPAPVYGLAVTMAIGVTVIPTFLIAEGIKRVGSGNASIIASIGPIFTLVLATTILGERISWLQVVGTLLVLAGVFLISWRGKR